MAGQDESLVGRGAIFARAETLAGCGEGGQMEEGIKRTALCICVQIREGCPEDIAIMWLTN